MTFLETSKPILREDFLQVESNLKIKFPGDFKEHFLKYNGGYPEKANIPGLKKRLHILIVLCQ